MRLSVCFSLYASVGVFGIGTSMRQKSIVTAEHAKWIGKIIVEVARLESALIPAIEAMAGMSRGPAIIMLWHMQLSDRMTRLRALFANHTRKASRLRTAFDALYKRLEDTQKLRNCLAHATWEPGREPKSIREIFVNVRGKELKVGAEDGDPVEVTVSDLKAEWRKVVKLNREFRSFFSEEFSGAISLPALIIAQQRSCTLASLAATGSSCRDTQSQ